MERKDKRARLRLFSEPDVIPDGFISCPALPQLPACCKERDAQNSAALPQFGANLIRPVGKPTALAKPVFPLDCHASDTPLCCRNSEMKPRNSKITFLKKKNNH